MTTLTRSVPSAVEDLAATPFRVVVPVQMSVDDAMAVYTALKADPNIKLQDPFFLPAVSSVFPGVRYSSIDFVAFDLEPIARIIDSLEIEDLVDAFVELDVPEALEDQAEALDVQDLTNL